MKETYTPQYSEICRLYKQDADDNRKLADDLFNAFLKRAERLKQKEECKGSLFSEDWLEEEQILTDELSRLFKQRKTVRDANAALADATTQEEKAWISSEQARREAEEAEQLDQALWDMLVDSDVYGNA